MIFGIDGTWLTSRRIEGQFPKFDELRPKDFKHEVPLPRDELLEVVRRTSVMAHRNSPLRLRFAEGEVTVWTQTQDVGEARETLPIAVHRRAAGDRVQRRLPARTGSSRPRATRSGCG